MTRVVTALDNSPTANPTLLTATVLAELLHADVQAVHVVEDDHATAEAVATRYDVVLDLRRGDVTDEIVSALAPPDVAAGVIGARNLPGGRQPTGHTTLEVLQRTLTPVVVVPPDCQRLGPRRDDHIVVPLDGTKTSADAMAAITAVFADAGIDIEVLHVFNPDTVPRFWDRPSYESELWADEFLRRQCATSAHLTLHTGDTVMRILDLCDQIQAGLIALAWGQDLSPGHADTVKDVLSHAHVPIMLVPTGADRQR